MSSHESNYWKRLLRRRLSRRAVLGVGAAAALSAAGLVGCQGNGGGGAPRATPGASPTGGEGPRFGDTLIQGRSVSVTGIDPHIDLTGLDIDFLLYSYLYSWNPATEEVVLNNLALEFEQPDPEHLEFIFTLRPGVRVHPLGPAAGEEITSADCVASFQRRGNSITAPDRRFPQRIDYYETPDPYTFKFVMKRPFVPAIREMANPTWAIVPAKVLEEHTSLSQVAFGSGPFMLDTFRGAEKIVLKKHPDFFLSPRPYLVSIQHVVITENSSLLAAFRSRQHDVNGAVLDKPTAEDLMENPEIVVNRQPSLFYPVIHIKMRPPFDDIRVRKALDLAINRDEIIQVIQYGEGNYNGPIQWAQTRWALPQDELRAFYRHDPEEAKRLLAEAGVPNVRARLKLPKLPGPTVVADIALLIKQQVAQVGFDLELDEVELGAFIGTVLLPGNFELAYFPNLPYDEPDRPLWFYHSRGVSGFGNWTGYTNPEIDRLIEAQAEEFDVERRREIIYEVQRMILKEHGPQLTLTGGYAYTAHWNYVHLGDQEGDIPPDQEPGPLGADWWVDKA